MLPIGLESAPVWAQNLFYGVMAVGAAYFAIKKVTSGVKDENARVRSTGKPSTVEEVVEAPENPPLPNTAISLLGTGLVDRQIAEDHLAVGRRVATALEDLEKRTAELLPMFDRHLEIQEHRLAQETEADRRTEMREELARMMQEQGLDPTPPGDRGSRIPGARPGRRPPR